MQASPHMSERLIALTRSQILALEIDTHEDICGQLSLLVGQSADLFFFLEPPADSFPFPPLLCVFGSWTLNNGSYLSYLYDTPETLVNVESKTGQRSSASNIVSKHNLSFRSDTGERPCPLPFLVRFECYPRSRRRRHFIRARVRRAVGCRTRVPRHRRECQAPPSKLISSDPQWILLLFSDS